MRSLRVRLAAFLLIPMAALAMTLAVGGTWFVETFVTRAFDRLLAGSILSISERLFVHDGQVSLIIPRASFDMLSNEEHDSIFYNVTAGGTFLTGYEDLPLPETLPPPGTLTYRDGVFRGRPVRIGMLLKPIYITHRTALVQVAQTTQARDVMARQMLLALTALGTVLAGIGCLLVWFAIRSGLTPLDRLRGQVEKRKLSGKGLVAPFAVDEVPQEALPLVLALNDLLAQLNRAMQVMRQFIADASHQLGTPVAILRSHLDLLDRQPAGSAAWRSSRADIDAAVARLGRLIAQLLTLANAEDDGDRRSQPEPLDLGDLAREVALDAAMDLRRRRIALSFEEPDETLAVTADPFLLGEALRNLIDNAARYNAAGGSVCVSVHRLHPDDGAPKACLTVEDDGPGIPEHLRALVFGRFYRVERADDPGGSGLGLAIVRAFVERNGGTIALSEGRDGRGLRATITLDEAKPAARCRSCP